MKPMTTHERMTRMFEHREADRVPVTDWIWESTLARWVAEGYPPGVDPVDHFGLDHVVALSVGNIDTSPRFERKVIEETDSYRIEQDEWGSVKKNFKPVSTTPQYLDHAVKDPDTWREAKERMTPSRDRINWRHLEGGYKTWRDNGAWICALPWFGYDIVNARMCGTDTILYAMADDPEWVKDMCDTMTDLALALLDIMWDEGYTFDELMWFDDMAYRNGMFFSKSMWREIVQPYQQRTIDWAHAHGIKVHLHCCGNINALIPDLIDMGLDALNPLEVKAGMDPVHMKKTYGDALLLRGGSDTRKWAHWEQVEADIKALLPAMIESGGYVFASDHSVPDFVTLDTFRRIVDLVKEVGTYS